VSARDYVKFAMLALALIAGTGIVLWALWVVEQYATD
jgi:hypothetical protein